MTAKEFVLKEYPKAEVYGMGHNDWAVYNGWLLLGCGDTQSSEWTNAKNNIKEKDTSVNPNE